MVKLVFGLLLVSIILIKFADSYYIGKIPTCTIIILCFNENINKKSEKNPLKMKDLSIVVS